MAVIGADIQPLSDDDPGQLGPYRLVGRLASGGMGRVYFGLSTVDGQPAAVKTLLAEGPVSIVDRRRFAREIKVVQRVRSAHTANLLGADPDDTRPWMATEYIPAPSLAELVGRAGTLSGSAARWVARGTVEALAVLHREHVVHRDVKPHNLLLPLTGPRLIDFGISHAADYTRTQLTLGTVAFASPEQARGEASTAASDIYSLGATLCYLVLGRAPYSGDGDMLQLLARVSAAAVDVTGLPEDLAPVIRACLAADPAGRPRTAELLEQFTFDLSELPTAADSVGWLPPSWTDLMEGYARQGHELAAAPWGMRPAADRRTEVLPPAPGTAPPLDPALSRPEPRHEERPGESWDGEASEAPTQGKPQPGKAARVAVAAVRIVMGGFLALVLGGGAYAYYMTEQAKEPDATDRAFSAMAVGECISTHLKDNGEWSSERPEPVSCDSAAASWRVTATKNDGPDYDCPLSAAARPWVRTSRAGTTSLCLEHQFTVGTCVLGSEEATRSVGSITDVSYLSPLNCDTTEPPTDGRVLLRITGYVPAPTGCPPGTAVRYSFPVKEMLLCLARA